MYNGGKNANGVYQTIINNFPKHTAYVELFLGSGAIIRNKRPASMNIGVEVNPEVVKKFHSKRAYSVVVDDVFNYMEREMVLYSPNTLVYADPPYIPETRKNPQIALYDFELSKNRHIYFLDKLKKLDAMVCISAYENKIYDKMLSGWRKVSFETGTRGGAATETIYMNYPHPVTLHEYTYLGKDCWDRQRIKRMIDGKIKQLEKMPPHQREAIIEAIINLRPGVK